MYTLAHVYIGTCILVHVYIGTCIYWDMYTCMWLLSCVRTTIQDIQLQFATILRFPVPLSIMTTLSQHKSYTKTYTLGHVSDETKISLADTPNLFQ